MENSMNGFLSWIKGVLRYRDREGMLAFLLHRLSGLATVLFLTIHVIDTATLFFAPALYNGLMAVYATPAFLAGEIGLIAGVIYHGVNGTRIALFDLLAPAAWRKDRERRSVWITIALSALLWLPAGWIMGGKLVAALWPAA
jgi:succinate dehydrogenase / fumarate reductase, cytochrome b subunit